MAASEQPHLAKRCGIRDLPPRLPELAGLVQKSALEESGKQRLLGLIYGWRNGR
jgi:hypothetical protein